MSRSLLAVMAAILVLSAGCVSTTESGKDFTVPDDAGPHKTVTKGGHTLQVLVTDVNGTPIEGAAVVFFESSTTESVFLWYAETTISYEAVAGVRTEADGKGSATLPPSSSIGVAAGDAPGLTTEVRPDVVLGEGGQTSQITVILYPATIKHTWDVNMENTVGRAGVQNAEYASFAMDYGLPDHKQALHDRVATAHLDVSWTNDLMSGADLFAGFSVNSAQPFLYGDDDQQVPMDGDHTESVEASSGDLADHREGISTHGLQAAVLTDWVSLGMNGVPVTLTIEATFIGSSFTISG